MTENRPGPNPAPPGPAGGLPAAQGIDLNKLQQLQQALGQYGPVLFEMIQKLAETFRPPGPALARSGPPGGPPDHGALCKAELEHLLAATAICLHHYRCSEQEAQPPG
jgi:hypothetical protein